MLVTQHEVETDFVRAIRKLQLTPEERKRRYGAGKPVDIDAWLAAGPPARAEELAEMEELMRMREEERQASLAREAGVQP